MSKMGLSTETGSYYDYALQISTRAHPRDMAYDFVDTGTFFKLRDTVSKINIFRKIYVAWTMISAWSASCAMEYT